MKIYSLKLTQSDFELADMFELSPRTVKNRSRVVSSLPPHTRVGKKKVWITQIALAWNSDSTLSTPIVLDLSWLPPVLNPFQLAAILHISKSSISSMRSLSPSSLPSKGNFGWVTYDVFRWLVKGLVGLPEGARIEVKPPVFQVHQVPARRSIGNDLSSLGRGE